MPSAEEDAAALAELLDKSEATRELKRKIDSFVTVLKRRKFSSSMELTRETLQLVRLLVGCKNWASPKELLQVVRAFGRRLVKARPMELVVGNVFRRVTHVVREEYFRMLKEMQETQQQSSKQIALTGSELDLQKLNESLDPKDSLLPSREIGMHDIVLYEDPKWNLKAIMIDAITEMITELENLTDPISKQALEHIHSDDVVLVFGDSGTVKLFVSAAAKKRRFRVIAVEASPSYSGHRLASDLSDLGVSTTLISDAAVFAMMARVNKVLLGTHAVMANGGLLAPSGSHMVALAAHHHSVPVICISGLYKLCPLFPYNRDSFIDLKSPGATASYAELGAVSDRVQVVSPSYDYVPPDLIDLFVTNTGGHQPSYIYRLLAEYYDINAEEEL